MPSDVSSPPSPPMAVERGERRSRAGGDNPSMDFRKLLVPIVALVLIGLSWRSFGWSGVALVVSGLVLVLLLQFNRAMQVLRRAADQPVGSVGSAVMLNAKLKPRATLMHVVALTRAIGELRTPKDTQPEIFRWTDPGGSRVDATFVNGRLTEWSMFRPPSAEQAEAAAGIGEQPAPAQAPRPPA